MMAYATIRDVAQRAGVSVSTVSRALNDSGRISPATRQRINQVIHDLHYVPDSRARSMHSAHSRTIGLLIPDIRNSYFADLAYLIQGQLLNHGFQTLICTSTQGDPGEDRAQVRNLLGQHIDGAIIVPGPRSSHTLEELTRRGLPLVCVDRAAEGAAGRDGRAIPCVDADPEPGLRQALEDLHAQGHRRITLVPGPLRESATFRERLDVYRDLLAGIEGMDDPLADQVEPGTFDPDMIDLWARQGITGVLFGSSLDAIRAIKTAQSRAISIGEDLSMITFDDLPVFRILTPAVSTISQQIDTMGTRCVDMLLALMAGSPVRSVRLQTSYRHCASVGRPPAHTGQDP